MSKRHWIAGNGSIGCLYDGCEVFTTKKDAIEYLAELYNDFRGVKTALREFHIWYNPKWGSLEYCEISLCECDNMNVHSDSGL